MILFINRNRCTSFGQLKDYFSQCIEFNSDIYWDLLDLGRSHDIAHWVREQTKNEDLARRLEDIDDNIGDSDYLSEMHRLISMSDGHRYEKPQFFDCFSLEMIKQGFKDKEFSVSIFLRVILAVNESFYIQVKTGWGIQTQIINPFTNKIGDEIIISFYFGKRLQEYLGDVNIHADGYLLSNNKSQKNHIEFNVNSVSFKMVKVDEGSFMMGAKGGDKEAFPIELPTHKVTLSPYMIGETVVTRALWKAVMGNNHEYDDDDNDDELPANNISWYNCQDFIQKLNELTDCQFRLPSEAEWEFAARGGNKSLHTNYSGSDNIEEVAWYADNSQKKIKTVKSKKANELGIYDMSGNVWELCQDYWCKYNDTEQINPLVSVAQECGFRVMRGGTVGSPERHCRFSYRNACFPNERHKYYSFRLALSTIY